MPLIIAYMQYHSEVCGQLKKKKCMNTNVNQGKVKTFIILQKFSISNKCFVFFTKFSFVNIFYILIF